VPLGDKRANSAPNPDGLDVACGSLSRCRVGIRIGSPTLLAVVLIPSLAAAGQRLDEDREERATYSRSPPPSAPPGSPARSHRPARSAGLPSPARGRRERTLRGSGRGARVVTAAASLTHRLRPAISSSLEAGLGSFWGEDPRYFRSGRPERWARVRHAVASVALAHRRDGHRAPAWGRFAGNVAGNVIENTWLPPSAATRSRTTARVATGVAGQLAANLWSEFWPDLRRRLPLRRLRGVRLSVTYACASS
jgi:hypothetical protein